MKRRPAGKTGFIVFAAGLVLLLTVLGLAGRAFFDNGTSSLSAERNRSDNRMYESLTGVWTATLPSGKAVFQAGKGVYQIIYMPTGGGAYRQYSRGVLRGGPETVRLEPHLDFGPPAGPGLSGFDYRPLASATIALTMRERDGALTWTRIDGENPQHPLFTFAGVAEIVWQPLPPAPQTP